METGDEETGDEKDETAESDLCGDERVHEATAGGRIFGSVDASFEGASGLNSGSAESGDQAEETSDGERESDAEEKHAPVGGKRETDRIV